MPPLRVVGGEKATVTSAYRAAEYLRAFYGGRWGVVGAYLGRQVQTICRPALAGNDEAHPGGVTSENATHFDCAFYFAEESVA